MPVTLSNRTSLTTLPEVHLVLSFSSPSLSSALHYAAKPTHGVLFQLQCYSVPFSSALQTDSVSCLSFSFCLMCFQHVYYCSLKYFLWQLLKNLHFTILALCHFHTGIDCGFSFKLKFSLSFESWVILIETWTFQGLCYETLNPILSFCISWLAGEEAHHLITAGGTEVQAPVSLSVGTKWGMD